MTLLTLLALSFKMSIIPYIFRSTTYILILVNHGSTIKMIESAKSAKSVMSFFYIPLILYMGSPQILICGESGGNGRTYDLAERYRPLQQEIKKESRPERQLSFLSPFRGLGAYSCINNCITTLALYATGVPGPKIAATPALYRKS